MSASMDDLRGMTAGAELECRVLEQQLAALDPTANPPYVFRLGPAENVRSRDYPDDELGRVRFRADLTAARREYLRGRFDELTARAERRQRAAADRRGGLDRFIGEGRLSLDELVHA